MAAIDFLLNGRFVRVNQPSAQMTLLDFVRARGLTGAKEGCAEGECGACAIGMIEPDERPGRSAFRVVNSCLLFLPMAAGRELYTVEALSPEGELTEVQRAIATGGGSQCGYCTPGFVLSLFAEHLRPDRRGPCDVMSMAGNLCRCTGYRPLRDAAASLGPAPEGSFRDRLDQPAPVLGPVDVPRFVRPATIDGCLAMLKGNPGAKPIAGATDLGVESNLSMRRWPQLVSLEAIDELRDFSDGIEGIKIGAGLPMDAIGRRWADAPQVVREWLTLFASPLIRNRATLGGNLATASPIGDAAPLLLALDARVHVAGPDGRRAVPLSQFFTGYRKTALRPVEILTAVEIPKPLPEFVRFYKVAKRRVDDISTVAAAMALDLDVAGRVQRARFAFGGVAATPLRSTEAEDAVTGEPWNEAAVARVQQILDRTLAPLSDHRGSKEYRLEVAKSLVMKFHWDLRG